MHDRKEHSLKHRNTSWQLSQIPRDDEIRPFEHLRSFENGEKINNRRSYAKTVSFLLNIMVLIDSLCY